MAVQRKPKKDVVNTPDAPVQETPTVAVAAPNMPKREYKVPKGAGKAQTNSGSLLVNMGPMVIIPNSLVEIKGRSGPGISARVKSANRVAPFSISSYDPDLIKLIKNYEKNGQPLNNLLEIQKGISKQTGKVVVYYNLTDLSTKKPCFGNMIRSTVEEAISTEGEAFERNSNFAFIQGRLFPKDIEETVGKDGNEYVRGHFYANGNRISFITPKEVAYGKTDQGEDCEIGLMLDKCKEKLASGSNGYETINMVAAVYPKMTPDGNVFIQVGEVERFYAPFSEGPKVSEDHYDEEPPIPEEYPSEEYPSAPGM